MAPARVPRIYITLYTLLLVSRSVAAADRALSKLALRRIIERKGKSRSMFYSSE